MYPVQQQVIADAIGRCAARIVRAAANLIRWDEKMGCELFALCCCAAHDGALRKSRGDLFARLRQLCGEKNGRGSPSAG